MLKVNREIKKYYAFTLIGVKNSWVYRFDQIFEFLFLSIVMYVFIELWRTTYTYMDISNFKGYTLSALILYLAVSEGLAISRTKMGENISKEILSGDIAYRLLRPVSYFGYQILTSFGELVIKVFINIVIAIILSYLLIGNLPINLNSLGIFIIVCILAIFVRLITIFLVAASAFWLEQNWAFLFAYERLLMFAGGALIPLDMLPSFIRNLLYYTPFYLIYFEPAKILITGNSSSLDIILKQLFWISALSIFSIFALKIGGKKLYVNGG